MNKYIFFSIVIYALFMTGCGDSTSSNLLDGSNIDQKQVKVIEDIPARHVEVFGSSIISFQYGDFDIDKFRLLTTPKDFDCGETFYASYNNQLLYLQLGEMGENHWFISNDSSTLEPNNFRHYAGCYFRNDDQIIYAGESVPTDLDNFKMLNAHYSRNDKDIFYGNEIIENADLDSFEVDPESKHRASDKENHYIYGHIDPNY